MAHRVDFSANSKIYDHRHGAVISDQLAQTVANHLRRDATIIDIGAGTGRVAVALACNGFRVVAVDPAVSMLQTMRRKSGEALVPAVAAEGTRLPFRRNSVDAVVLAGLLYLVADWRGLLREAKEVLRQGGFLFHEWGNGDAGEAWVQVREKRGTPVGELKSNPRRRLLRGSSLPAVVGQCDVSESKAPTARRAELRSSLDWI
jgi:ubiquinone/menaquinone biosynthesis C-methylase UbiE